VVVQIAVCSLLNVLKGLLNVTSIGGDGSGNQAERECTDKAIITHKCE